MIVVHSLQLVESEVTSLQIINFGLFRIKNFERTVYHDLFMKYKLILFTLPDPFESAFTVLAESQKRC